MLSDYIKEREGKSVLETEDGFAVHSMISEHVCYIEDIYIRPEARKSNKAAEIANQICDEAKAKGAKQLLGSVDSRARGATTSLKVLLAYGMRLSSVEGSMIYFVKEL